MSLIFETPFGKLEVDTCSLDEMRIITFEEEALTISGVNIHTITYGYEPSLRGNLPPDTVSNFEKYLLTEPHSFDKKDVNRIVEKFGLSKYFPLLLQIMFFLDDSGSIYFTISPSCSDEKSFVLEILSNDDKDFEEIGSWEINIGTDGDILASALEYVCLLTKAIYNKKLSIFITKMNLLNR